MIYYIHLFLPVETLISFSEIFISFILLFICTDFVHYVKSGYLITGWEMFQSFACYLGTCVKKKMYRLTLSLFEKHVVILVIITIGFKILIGSKWPYILLFNMRLFNFKSWTRWWRKVPNTWRWQENKVK